MNKKAHDAIMKEFKKQLTQTYTRGVVVGIKLGAHYVAEKLKTPEDWSKMSESELISLLGEGIAMSEAIQNGKLGIGEEIKNEDNVLIEDDDNNET